MVVALFACVAEFGSSGLI